MTTITQMTAGQRKQLIRFYEDAVQKGALEAIDEAVLTKDIAQSLLEQGDRLQTCLKIAIAQHICSVSVELRQNEDRQIETYQNE